MKEHSYFHKGNHITVVRFRGSVYTRLIKPNNTTMTYCNYLLHSIFGNPAIIHPDGKLEWYNYGVKVGTNEALLSS